MATFKPNLLTLALLAAGANSMAYAADADTSAKAKEDEKTVEVIEVTGIRRSLQASQSLKMDSSSIVEAVSAEDIGKLPDVSIGESIARLPGLAAQRLDGRANVISIRGLGPDFTATTLNGREQVTISDNRGVEFDQYPSELMSGVVVYKTPDANIMAQGIGGTVDMQTVRPLAHGEQSISVGARFEHNDLGALNAGSTANGSRFNLSYIDQFADDTIGLALGVATMTSPNQEQRFQAWGYPTDANGDLIIGGIKPYVRSSELERTGVMAILEFKPNDKFHSIVDAYYSDFRDEQMLRGIEIPLAWGGGWANDSVDSINADSGLVLKGQANGAAVQMRNDVNLREADTTALGWRVDYQLSDDWSLMSDLSYSKANRQDWGLEAYAGTGRGNGVGAEDTLGFEMRPGNEGILLSHNLNYADPSLFLLGGAFSWGNGNTVPSDGQDGFINTPSIDDELSALRLSAKRLISDSPFSSIEFGVNVSSREKSKQDKGYFLTLKTYPGMQAVPSQYLLAPTSLEFIGMGNMLSFDSLSFYNDGNYNVTDEGITVSSRATNSWTVTEDVTTAFIKANLDTEIGATAVKGNIGLQVVQTDQSSDGFAVNLNEQQKVEIQPSYGEYKYTEALPSINLNFAIAENMNIRVGAARTLARARMDEMNASFRIDWDADKVDLPAPQPSPWSASGGNTALKPWLAKQYDLSYEWYFADQGEGYFAAALYYKDLENFIFKELQEFDFSAYNAPGDKTPAQYTGIYTAPTNGNGGFVKGAEATVSVAGGMISPMLEGFGVILSYSYTDSEVKEHADSTPTQLLGLSKNVFNATAYYERNGFQFRVSMRDRSDFLGEVSGLSMKRDQVFIKGETLIDAQVGYDFSESGIESLYGLTVNFQINNLTDEPFTSYLNGDERQVRDYQVYGRNLMLGVNYKF